MITWEAFKCMVDTVYWVLVGLIDAINRRLQDAWSVSGMQGAMFERGRGGTHIIVVFL